MPRYPRPSRRRNSASYRGRGDYRKWLPRVTGALAGAGALGYLGYKAFNPSPDILIDPIGKHFGERLSNFQNWKPMVGASRFEHNTNPFTDPRVPSGPVAGIVKEAVLSDSPSGVF